MKKDINHKKAIEIISRLGIKVIGTSKDFSSRYTDDGLWIDAEGSSDDCFSSDKWFNTDGINPDIAPSLYDLGYWSEWQDAGTLILWKRDIDKLTKLYGK
jgi:hypothetical protein